MFDYKDFLKKTPKLPGVYRMYDSLGIIIYVGKAKNLKNRLSSYFKINLKHIKTQALVSKIAKIDISISNSEMEALLLEQNYIKHYKPRYNILLKDDKSYPYILLTNDEYPKFTYYRGKNLSKKLGTFFGPYPNISSINETIDIIPKIFKLRTCSNSFMKNRSRACLEYQIKRCSAPCMNYVTNKEYLEQVKHAKLFLNGKNNEVLKYLKDKMLIASKDLLFEEAAEYRDKISLINKIYTEQNVILNNIANADIISLVTKENNHCIQISFVRHGKLLGTNPYFLSAPKDSSYENILKSFIEQFYLEISPSSAIAINYEFKLKTKLYLERILSEKISSKVIISSNKEKFTKLISFTNKNAMNNLNNYLHKNSQLINGYLELENILNIKINSMECFDISHLMGKNTIASCVVFGKNGPDKVKYRYFNIDNITP
ncbi:MAG: excinuclease ABC subunit UvrC, partial [Psittacicella sp.]